MTTAIAPIHDFIDRHLQHIRFREDGCAEWCRALNADGYGRVKRGGTTQLVHRVVYELVKGPIPSGLQIDHLCRFRACVNPEHLEVVTIRDNQLRGNSVSGVNARKTECPQGHPYSGDNLYVRSRGSRECRTCGRIRRREYVLRKTALMD